MHHPKVGAFPMNRLATLAGLALAPGLALADKYGLDEMDSSSGSSWGALVLVVALFAYLYFKEK